MKPVTADLQKRRKQLPHWQQGGCTYFITFRSARGILPEIALRQVIKNIEFDHRKKYELFFAVVMPDHVHLLLKPLQKSPNCCWDLSEILRGIKGTSARFINKLLGTGGAVWQEESFDRIIRDQKEFDEKLQYIWDNPVDAGLVEASEEYLYFVYQPD